jgi:hypothetical protein
MKTINYILAFLIILASNLVAQKPLLQYVKNIGAPGTNFAGDPLIVVDGVGNLYTAGYFSGTVDFNPESGVNNITSIGSNDAYISKFDNNGNFIWAKNFGGNGATYCLGLTLDNSGNIYINGNFNNTTDFDPNTGISNLTSQGGSDAFISKLDGNGNLIWVKSIGGISDEYGKSIAVDASGNVIATGTYSGTVDFDPSASVFNLSPVGASDIYILKLDASGNFVWAQSIGGASNETANSMKIDATGNIYTTGQFEATIDFDPSASVFNLTSSGAEDLFISKLDGNGNFIWAKSIGGTSTDIAYGISIDAHGKIYVTGYYSGTVDFDPNGGTTNLISIGGDDIFLLKLDNVGNFIWAKSMGGTGLEYGKVIDLDNVGNPHISGLYNGTADFDPNTGIANLIPNGGFDVFITKIDTVGNFVWAKNIGGSDMDYGTAIALDNNNSIYTAGKFGGKVDFDPNMGVKNITSIGSYDAFIHKMMPCNIKTLSGTVTGSSSGNVILYQYVPTLSKWDSVAFTPYTSSFSFGLTDSSTYVLKAVPSITSEQVTYAPSSISWKNATTISHGCTANTTQSISIATFTNIGTGSGSFSGKIYQGNGFGKRVKNPEEINTPGGPIGGLIVKGGRNPGGQMFVQTTTAADGTYTLQGIPYNGTSDEYFILVDIPGIDTNGTYHRTLTVGNNQLSGLDFTIDSIYVNPQSYNTIGVHKISIIENQIKVLPNPASNKVTIQYNLKVNSNVQIELYDIFGKSIKMILPLTLQNSAEHLHNIPLNDISSGMYFIKLKINNSESIVKLFITN